MKVKNSLELNFETWLYIADLQHKIVLVREKELSHYNITPQKLHVLRLIEALGPKATLSAIAKAVDRKFDVISKQAVMLEKDGLITRTKFKRKSRLFKLELTERGQELLKINKYSDGMNEVLSILSKDELIEFHSVLNRLLIKLKQYDPENSATKLF